MKQFAPLFLGEELYQDLRRIKAAFAPHNCLNSGKIVTPIGSEDTIVPLESPLRWQFDRQVPQEMQADYEVAFRCNGNGACFNVNSDQVMCPSYKGMRSRIHSPEGQASLLREWLRQLATHPGYSSVAQGDMDSTQGTQSPTSIPSKLWNSINKLAGRYDSLASVTSDSSTAPFSMNGVALGFASPDESIAAMQDFETSEGDRLESARTLVVICSSASLEAQITARNEVMGKGDRLI